IVGLYLFLRWVEDRKSAPFFVAATAISLSFLIKITSIVVIAPLAYLTVAGTGGPGFLASLIGGGGRDHRSRLQLALIAVIALLPSALWYRHAHQIAQTFYPHHFFGAGGIRIENLLWYWHIARQTLTTSLTPVLSLMALIGLFVPQSRDRKYSRLFHWWLTAMVFFVVVVGYGNRHLWYQLPFVPILAAFAGAACAFVVSRIPSLVITLTL